MRVLVTGAHGFVGQALCKQLIALDYEVVRGVRIAKHADEWAVGDIDSRTNWSDALRGCDVVVHLAARVHQMNEKKQDQLEQYFRTNVDGTANLAKQAAASGVKRFIFLSSIKVNGESTPPGAAFKASDEPRPEDPYGVSKFQAESCLVQIAEASGMAWVVIRSPLIYGPKVKGNFATMMRWLRLGVPLPLAGVTQNRRSFIALGNLTDFIAVCSTHPLSVNQVFLVSDGVALSTAELLKKMAQAMGRKCRLFYLPMAWLAWGARLAKRQAIYERLCGSLEVDMQDTQRTLGWSPPLSIEQGLELAARGDAK